MLKTYKGNLFSSSCQTIVNTVNCVGIMGAGIALEYRLRYPKMYKKYVEYCNAGLIKIGSLWLYKHSDEKWILNFPTKNHWKYPSKTEYLQMGLDKFIDSYEQKGITSVAFPILGSEKGELPKDKSKGIMEEYLSNCKILVEIYEYDRDSTDDEFEIYKQQFLQTGLNQLMNDCGIQHRYAIKLEKALNNPNINSLSSLCSVKGLGIQTVEKTFNFLMH